MSFCSDPCGVLRQLYCLHLCWTIHTDLWQAVTGSYSPSAHSVIEELIVLKPLWFPFNEATRETSLCQFNIQFVLTLAGSCLLTHILLSNRPALPIWAIMMTSGTSNMWNVAGNYTNCLFYKRFFTHKPIDIIHRCDASPDFQNSVAFCHCILSW